LRYNEELTVGAELANRVQYPSGSTQEVQDELAAVSRGFEHQHEVRQGDDRLCTDRDHDN